MDKQKLEEKKMDYVCQLNVINEQIEEYWLWCIAWDGGYFKWLCQKKQYVEEQIKFINKQLECCE